MPVENYVYIVGNDFGVYKYSTFTGAILLTAENTQYPGLASNRVNDAAQDVDGNMWFALQDSGVARFDGTHFYARRRFSTFVRRLRIKLRPLFLHRGE